MTEMIGAGVFAPAAIGLAVYLLLSRLLPDRASRLLVVVALLAGFLTGYLLLHEWTVLKPARHWHWLPWMGVVAGFTGSLGLRAAAPIRWMLMLATSVAAAWFLVPTWADLDPPRVVWLIAVSAGLWLLIALTDPLPPRIGGRLVLGLLGLTAATVAVMIAACVSVSYAQVAGLAACALGGVWGGICLRGRDDELAVRAAIPAAVILVGGIAFVACIETEPPQYGLLLLPAALLGLWICRLPALSRLTGRKATLLRIASVVILLLAAAGVSYARVL
jgi:hypothetical protein